MSRIYLDMDGVLADYEGGIKRHGVVNYPNGKKWIHRPRSEWPQEMIDADRSYVECMAHPEFWRVLHVLPGASALVAACINMVGPDQVYILTATPNRMDEHIKRIAQDKVDWAYRYFGFTTSHIITCARHEKKNYAVPGSVLVDDTEANCEEWRSTGNVAIHFTNATQAISDLAKVIYGY